MIEAISNGKDTAETSEKVPFIKAKDIKRELLGISIRSDMSHQKRGDTLLRKILASLAKGRADDQKAVAAVAKEIVESGMYGPGNAMYDR
jgi:hypothetical protein